MQEQSFTGGYSVERKNQGSSFGLPGQRFWERNRISIYCKLLAEAERRKEVNWHQKNVQAIIYREEPFIYDCDSISFQVYLMIVRKGVWKQKIMVEKM